MAHVNARKEQQVSQATLHYHITFSIRDVGSHHVRSNHKPSYPLDPLAPSLDRHEVRRTPRPTLQQMPMLGSAGSAVQVFSRVSEEKKAC